MFSSFFINSFCSSELLGLVAPISIIIERQEKNLIQIPFICIHDRAPNFKQMLNMIIYVDRKIDLILRKRYRLILDFIVSIQV